MLAQDLSPCSALSIAIIHRDFGIYNIYTHIMSYEETADLSSFRLYRVSSRVTLIIYKRDWLSYYSDSLIENKAGWKTRFLYQSFILYIYCSGQLLQESQLISALITRPTLTDRSKLFLPSTILPVLVEYFIMHIRATARCASR